MKWSIYYIVSILLNVIVLVVFRQHIHLDWISILPLALMLNSAYQAYYHATDHEERGFHTTYSAKNDITDAEWQQVTKYIVSSHLLMIPLFVPFIFFFSWGKLVSFLLFLIAFVGGGILYRIRHGKELRERYEREQNELHEQQKNEEMGRWK